MTRERKMELLNELLELEEKNDIGNLTSRDRADFQIWVKEVLEQEPKTEGKDTDVPTKQELKAEKAIKMREATPEERESIDKYIKSISKSTGVDFWDLKREPKTGHWIIIDDCEKFIAKCSECGRIEDSRMIHKYPYCHCGAKMERSVEDGSN